MNPEQVEELLRRAGRPLEPPARLRGAVLQVPAGTVLPRQPRVWRIRIAAAAAAVLLLAGSAAVVQQLTSFHAVAAVTLQGVPGAQATAEVGAASGPNRPVRLIVEHLQPGRQGYYELWSLNERPAMMLTTFMTNTDGSCTITFSMPATMQWGNWVVTPRDQSNTYLLHSSR